MSLAGQFILASLMGTWTGTLYAFLFVHERKSAIIVSRAPGIRSLFLRFCFKMVMLAFMSCLLTYPLLWGTIPFILALVHVLATFWLVVYARA